MLVRLTERVVEGGMVQVEKAMAQLRVTRAGLWMMPAWAISKSSVGGLE